LQHIVHILEATTGGTRRHLRDLVTGLDPHLFRQTLIVATRRDPDFVNDLELYRARGIRVEVVDMRRSPAPLKDFTALRRITGLLREMAPDIVHTHSSKAGIVGRLAARRAGVPRLIHTPHVFAYEMQAPAPARLAALLLERLVSRWTHRLICVSEAEARAARRLGPACPPLEIIRNGIAVPSEPPAAPHFETPLRFALIGRLCRQKGQDILARALLAHSELARTHRFEFVGIPTGQDLPDFVSTAAVSGLCHILPPLAPDEMEQYLQEVDVVVMPSRWEGLPYTLLEAMAQSRSIVAANVGGVSEVVRQAVNGLLVEGEEPAAWAAALREIVNDPAAARRRARAGFETVATEFKLETMLQKLTAVYQAEATAAQANGNK